MLSELRIRDLAIIDRLDLTFGAGFNVLTGETGAGKSIIIDAVNLLLGDRASQEVVRAGAERTEVEGAFQLGSSAVARLASLLAEHGLESDQPDTVVLAREVRANGRSVARINGRAVTTALLGEVGGLLVDVHGQGEHLSLLREREHVGLLDRYAGLNGQAAAVAELARRVRRVRRELEGLRQDERERARRIDLLTYQAQEIRAAKLKPAEEAELEQERRRLANAEQLAALSNEAVMALSGGDAEMAGALDALGAAGQALARLAKVDPASAPLAEQLEEATALVDDLARELAHYRDGVEFNPQRLQQVEERLHLIRGLLRKYGDTVEEALAYGERAAAELETISHAEEHIGALEAEEADLLAELGRQGAALSAARRAAGARMAAAIEAELADLQMARARFAVDVSWAADPAGATVEAEAASSAGQPAGRYAFDSHGLDAVAFLVSANPGEPLKPLAKVASGGETSRLMLALKTVLGRADETPTLIFDEIDQGIGGRVGGTVGRKLWGLTGGQGAGSRGQRSEIRDQGAGGRGQESDANLQPPTSNVQHPTSNLQPPTSNLQPPTPNLQPPTSNSQSPTHQVLCITHLPQLAAYGDAHFHVLKHVAGERTVTEVQVLTGDDRVAELAQMMGADSEAGRASVMEMMAEVAEVKRSK